MRIVRPVQYNKKHRRQLIAVVLLPYIIYALILYVARVYIPMMMIWTVEISPLDHDRMSDIGVPGVYHQALKNREGVRIGSSDSFPVRKCGPRISESGSPSMLLPKPVIVVGFPKAGTTSLYHFFRRNGLSTMHWYCCRNAEESMQSDGSRRDGRGVGGILMSSCMLENLAVGNFLFHRCGHFDVYTEMNGPRPRVVADGKVGYMSDDGTFDFEGPGSRLFVPQHHYLHLIHDEHPNATFLLNLRPVSSWVDSVLHSGDDLAWQLIREFHMQSPDVVPLPSDVDKEENENFDNTSIDKLSDVLSSIYEDHVRVVRKFVREHPSHALVEVDISSSDAGIHLADAFGLDAGCWGHKNERVERASQ